MKIDKHNIVANKMSYARGKRPPVDCILCGVVAGHPQVDNLMVYAGDEFFITLNLYPYNPGHVMVVPKRHVEHLRDITGDEARAIHHYQLFAMEVLETVYQPGGFNVGYNVGRSSGASIPHLHLQIVPRYPTELGFFDILGDSRVIVEEPQITRERLSAAFEQAAPGFFSRDLP